MIYGTSVMAFNINSNMMWKNNCEYQQADINPQTDVDVNLLYSDNKEYQRFNAINRACDHDNYEFKTNFGFKN